jgi:tetratricopeptide (TPR) repeat protein
MAYSRRGMSVHNSNPIAEAVGFFERGDLASAERTVAALLVRENCADALHLLGLIRLQQNRLDEAVSLLNRSLSERPEHPHVLLNLAKTQRMMNHNAEAVEALHAAVAVQPHLAEAWYELGMNMLHVGDSGAAESHFRKALDLEPGHLSALLWLGVALKDNGQPVKAESLLAEGLAKANAPEMKGAFALNLAHAQHGQGKRDAALANFELAAQLDKNLSADINRADLLEEMLRMEEAAKTLEELVGREPTNAAAHAAYNNLLHRLGRDDEFLTSYDRAPPDDGLQTARAGFLLKAGRQHEAYELYAGLATRDPANIDAAIGAATALNALRRPGEAIEYLEQALSRNRQSAPLYQNLASTALQNRDPQKAAAMAEKSLILSPVDQAGLAVLGSAWRMMGDERDEILNGYDDLIQVIDLPPPDGFADMADFNIALSAWLETRHPKTREPLMQSLRGGSQTPGFMFNQGHALVEKLRVRIDEALAQYIAEIKPDARHPFRGRCGRGFRFADSWSSRLKDCGFHANHIHPGGWISSCYYVALPETVKDENRKQGWIKFGEPSFDAGLGIRRLVQPKVGRLVLFPSYMWHGTVPFHEDAVRTTIAFDAVPHG